MNRVFEHLDEALARVMRTRDELLADPTAANRATRLAAVFESEARVWAQLYELSGSRLVWRSASAAEAGARANAAVWARRAAAEGRDVATAPSRTVPVPRTTESRRLAFVPVGRGRDR